MRPIAIASLFACAVGACAHAAAPRSAAPVAVDPTAAQRDAAAALAAGRYDDALADLAPLTDDDAPYATRVVYLRATARLYLGDSDGASRLFHARIDHAHAHHRPLDEAWLHNVLTWVRWSQGDHAGALAENEEVARAVADPSVSAGDRRGTLLHYWWDRAYLLAEDPATRDAADLARRSYEGLADPVADRAGLAVLHAFFAVIDHEGERARSFAAQVDPAHDDDLQDLYVLALAHDAAGDRAAALALRAMIRRGSEYPMKPILLHRMEREHQ
jgi:hypothetical protein